MLKTQCVDSKAVLKVKKTWKNILKKKPTTTTTPILGIGELNNANHPGARLTMKILSTPKMANVLKPSYCGQSNPRIDQIERMSGLKPQIGIVC